MSANSYLPNETIPKGQQSFSWDNVTPTIPEQWQISVYTNSIGGVVVRSKEPGGYDDEDGVVVLTSAEHVRSLIKALQREIGDA
jgi:hypothetical protein